MSERKFFQCMLVFVLISAVLACKTSVITPEISKTVPMESGISLKLTLVTGSDETADNPVFDLIDGSGNILFTTTLDRTGVQHPNQTYTYEFTIPHSFCQITGWLLSKPSNSNIDDAWLPTGITIELDGKIVYFDNSLSDLGPITASSPRSGNWSGTDVYQQQCGN